MIRLPRKYRSVDDDYAPLDYEFVGSVNEGQRRREAEAMLDSANSAVIRRRAQPDERVDEYGTHARKSAAATGEKPRGMEKQLPSAANGARVRHMVYPEGYVSRGEQPEAEAAEAPGARDSGRRDRVIGAFAASDDAPPHQVESAGMLSREEPQALEFDAPVAPDIPEWLRVAKQNNMPQEERRLRPRVVPAPRADEPQTDMLGRPMRNAKKAPPPAALPQTATDYADAGYPPELLQQQEIYDQRLLAEQYGSKRHGAQHAVRPDSQARRAGRAERVQRSFSQEEHHGGSIPQPAQRREPLPMDGEGAGPWPTPPMPRQPYQPPYDGGELHSDLVYAPAEYAQRGDSAMGNAPAAQRSPRRRSRAEAASGWQQAPEWEESPQWDEPSTETMARRIPWLGIAAAVLALVAVLLWILQMSFSNRTQETFLARAKAQAAIAEKYPYQYRELIETQAQVNNLHPAFIAAIVMNESSFRINAESRVGARGLMQIMHDTAEWIHGKIGEGEAFDFDQMYDPATNVRYACWYLDYLSDLFRGDTVLVAAGFHAGQGEVKNWLNDSRYSADNQTIVLEAMIDGNTKEYVTKVLDAYAFYKREFYEDAGV